jgi:lysozyme
MQENKVDARCIELIKLYEGLRLKSYRCPAGLLTIGYGHTGPDVLEGQSITEKMAESLLFLDVQEALNSLNKLVKVPLSLGQAGALTSMLFNFGAKALATSTLFWLVNQKDFVLAEQQFSRWIYVNGVSSDGLRRRRAAERRLFTS